MPLFDFDGANFNLSTNNASARTLTLSTTFNDPDLGVSLRVKYTVSFEAVGSVLTTLSAANGDINIGFSGTTSTTRGGASVTNRLDADSVRLTFSLVNPTPSMTGFDLTPTLSLSGNQTLQGSVTSNGTGIVFTRGFVRDGDASLDIFSLNADFTCFCAGTLIATPEGDTPVEDLRESDMLRLADGREVPVRWVGRQRVSPLSHPKRANPIRITAGALGDGLPKRDLRVSQDHALCIDGMLITAGALINGTTIYQEREMPREGFTYYHVETEAHELILAEGCAAETYVDYLAEGTFDNAGGREARVIPEMGLPRVSSARMVPDALRRRLVPLIAAE